MGNSPWAYAVSASVRSGTLLMMDEVHTERLIGTRPLLRDARSCTRCWTTGRRSPPPAPALLRDMDHWKRQRCGRWIWRRDGELVARAGLLRIADDDVELAWFVAAAHRGQGLATEIARFAIGVAFSELGLTRLSAKTEPSNAASLGVMRRCGMTYERDIVHAGLPHVRYVLTNASS